MDLWGIFLSKISLFIVLNIFQGIFLYLFVKHDKLTYLGLLILFSLLSNISMLFYLNNKTRTWYIYNYMIAFIFIVLPALMASLYLDVNKYVKVIFYFEKYTYSGIMVFFATLFLMVFANIQDFLEDTKFKEEEQKFKQKIKLYKPIALLFAFVGILAYAVPFATNPKADKIEEILFICSYLSITMFAQIAVLFKQDLQNLEDLTNRRRPENDYHYRFYK